MQSKPFSGFSAKFEKEVSSSAGEVSVSRKPDVWEKLYGEIYDIIREELKRTRAATVTEGAASAR